MTTNIVIFGHRPLPKTLIYREQNETFQQSGK